MEDLLLIPEQVVMYAFADADYTPSQRIATATIVAAQQRRIIPVIGEPLAAIFAESVADNMMPTGKYEPLYEQYVAPAAAEAVRLEMCDHAATEYPILLQRTRTMVKRMSDYLEANAALFEEYDPEKNILNKLSINGAYIQIH